MVRRVVVIAIALAAAAAAAWTFLPLAASYTTTSAAFPGGSVPPEISMQRSVAWDSAWMLAVIWAPVLVAAAPLLGGSARSETAVTVLAAILLAAFVVVAGFSIGLFYAPAAVAMAIAAVRALKRIPEPDRNSVRP